MFGKYKRKKIYMQAQDCIKREDYLEAISYLNEVEDYFTEDYNFIYSFAYSYFMLKDYENSLKYCNKCLEIDPEEESMIILKSVCLSYLKRYDDALICINNFLNTYNSSPLLLKNKIKIIRLKIQDCIKREDYLEAVSYLNEVEDYFMEDYDFTYSFAYSYFMLKDYENSLKYCNMCIEINRDDEKAINLKSGCLCYLKRFDDALKCLNNYLDTHDSTNSLLKNKKTIEELMNCS